MFNESTDPFVAETKTRRANAEAVEEYAIKTQQMAALSVQTKYIDMDTGEVRYGATPVDQADAAASTASVVVEPVRPAPLPPSDPEAAFRRGRLGVVAAIVLVLFWVWMRQRRSAVG
ncbi:MAG: hypothetical protein J5727_08360 [Kiritimatiellae bacterium]|nr:hypothetical protein [Kiritimatiellia bacterium]